MPEIALQSPPLPLTSLTDDEVLFRDSVRQFADEKVRPLAKEMDEKAVFDQGLIDQFFQLGLMGIEIPEQFGGAGGKFFEAILAVEELSRADASAGVIVDVQNTLVNNALLRWATAEQKKRCLPRMAADTAGAYALSEAGSGSDAFALKTRAELKGSDYVLNGRKLWITNAKEAGLFVLFATVDLSAGYKGITAFIIEKEFPGFTVGKKEDKLGIRASSTCELILEDCRVAKANVLGEVGKGYKIAIETLNEGRIGIGAQMAGVARGAWEYAVRYAHERKQFGKTSVGSPPRAEIFAAGLLTNGRHARRTAGASRLSQFSKDVDFSNVERACMRNYTILLIAAFTLSVTVSAQTADQLVQKNIEAKGGIEKLKAIKTVRLTGKLDGGGGFTAVVGQENKRPNQVRETLILQGMTQVQAFDGSTAWEIRPFGGRKDPQLMGDDDVRDLLIDSDLDGPLVDYKAKGHQVEYLGHDVVDGDDALRLKVTLKNGDIIFYDLDTDTFL